MFANYVCELLVCFYFITQGSVSGEESTTSKKSHKRKASRAASPAGEQEKLYIGLEARGHEIFGNFSSAHVDIALT